MSESLPFAVKLALEDTAREAVDRFAGGLRDLSLPLNHAVNVTLTQRDEDYCYAVTITACVRENAAIGGGGEGESA